MMMARLAGAPGAAITFWILSGCGPGPDQGASERTERDVGFGASSNASASGTAPGALRTTFEQHALPPRGITLEVPAEHALVSGGVDTFVGRPPRGFLAFAGPGQPPLPIYLNRFGGTFSPGADDSRFNASIVPSQPSTVSGYSGSNDEWSEVVSCLTEMFSAYNVVIVQNEPAGGEYVEAVIGGQPQQLGLPNGVGGVAPIDSFRCSILPNAIVFAFSDVVGSNPRATCEIAAQEIAHAFSLDHEYHCPDPMTYLGGCGPKTFRNFDAQCGEFQPRTCNCGRQRQNSVNVLTEKLGAWNGQVPPPPPNDPVPPMVDITEPSDGATLQSDSTITVAASATDDVQIAATELLWAFTNTVIPCPFTGSGGSVTCARTGNVSTWRLRVGQGDRRFSVRVRDTAGNSVETQQRLIHLGTPPPASTDTTPPTAAIVSPEDGAVLPAESTIRITADVTDDVGLASVELVWSFGQDAFPCPFSGQGVSCSVQGATYAWSLSVGVGQRQFSVRAVDLAGNRFETAQRTITLATNPQIPPDAGADVVGEENDSARDAFPSRCGNAIDLVVTATDEDWFSFDAPPGTTVEVNVSAATGAVIGLELFAADGQAPLAGTDDALSVGGSVRAVSSGPVLLARITTTAVSVGYRLTALCAGPPSNEPSSSSPEGPPMGQDAPPTSDLPRAFREKDVLTGECGCTSAARANGSSSPLAIGLAALLLAGRRRRRSLDHRRISNP